MGPCAGVDYNLPYLIVNSIVSYPSPLPQRDYYCKRAILCLSSSKILTILTPHPPLRVNPPPFLGGGGEDTLAGRRGGWGVNILEDESHRIALLQ
jgi:hypothetical protein